MAATALALGLGIPLIIFTWAVFLYVWKRKELIEWHNRSEQPQRSYIPATSQSKHKYDEEFRTISQMDIQLSCNEAKKPQNANKNRYRDVIPYDHNRVILNQGSYINASHVGDLFIATQDPLPDQDEDFWIMIWEKRVSIIIRLSSDSSQIPMAKYVPDIENDSWVFGVEEIKVTCLMFNYFGYIKIANLFVEKGNENRMVVMYHLTSWKAGSTPSVHDVLTLLSIAHSTHEKNDGLVLVHCGAGSGRTGTVIALWKIREQCLQRQSPNIHQIVSNLRYERPGMVQTADQYAFLYKCLKKYSMNPVAWERSAIV